MWENAKWLFEQSQILFTICKVSNRSQFVRLCRCTLRFLSFHLCPCGPSGSFQHVIHDATSTHVAASMLEDDRDANLLFDNRLSCMHARKLNFWSPENDRVRRAAGNLVGARLHTWTVGMNVNPIQPKCKTVPNSFQVGSAIELTCSNIYGINSCKTQIFNINIDDHRYHSHVVALKMCLWPFNWPKTLVFSLNHALRTLRAANHSTMTAFPTFSELAGPKLIRKCAKPAKNWVFLFIWHHTTLAFKALTTITTLKRFFNISTCSI